MSNALGPDDGKPIPESYWVVPGSFLAGQYPASTRGDDFATRQRLTSFLNLGFDTFFDLTAPGELPGYDTVLREEAAHYGLPVEHRRFPVGDFGLPSPEGMRSLLEALDAALGAGRRVYLHCWGGIGRTGTAVGCWLVRHGLDGERALQRLAGLYATAGQSRQHPRSPETDAQVDFIRTWKDS
jgi:hypothetical protein